MIDDDISDNHISDGSITDEMATSAMAGLYDDSNSGEHVNVDNIMLICISQGVFDVAAGPALPRIRPRPPGRLEARSGPGPLFTMKERTTATTRRRRLRANEGRPITEKPGRHQSTHTLSSASWTAPFPSACTRAHTHTHRP